MRQFRADHRNRCRATFVLAMAVTLLPAGAKLAVAAERDGKPDSDWASFRNGNEQQGVAGSPLPEKLEILWKKSSPDGFVATAAIVGDRVYAGALSGDFYCLDLATGREIWAYRSIDSQDPDEFAPGFKAAPRITDDSVFVGDEDGVIHALDRVSGKRRWQFRTDAEVAGCPAVVGDRLIIGSHDSFLYCLNRKDGKVIWRFQTDDRVNCSPAIAGNFTFVAGCDEHLRVINIESGEQEADIPLGSYLIASPAIRGDFLYVGTYAAEVVAVNWKTREFAWRFKDEKLEFPYHASAAVTEDRVVVGGQDKRVHCIDRESGRGVWDFVTRAQVNSSPVVVGDRVFVGSNDGNLYELRLQDGEQLARFNLGKDISASPAVGQQCLVIGAEGRNGSLYCLGASRQSGR